MSTKPRRELRPLSPRPPHGGGGVTPSYPKWMTDALSSDLNALIEAREAPARAERAAQAASIRGTIRTVLQHIERRGDVTWTAEYLEQTARDIEKTLGL